MAFKRLEDQHGGEARDGRGVGLKAILGGFARPLTPYEPKGCLGASSSPPRVGCGTWQSTARIDRTARAAYLWGLLRATTSPGIDRQRMVNDRGRETLPDRRKGVSMSRPRRIAADLPLLPSLGSTPSLRRRALDG